VPGAGFGCRSYAVDTKLLGQLLDDLIGGGLNFNHFCLPYLIAQSKRNTFTPANET
jgi:hypothetical protein